MVGRGLLFLLTILSLTFVGSHASDDLVGSTYFHLVLKVKNYILPFLNYSTMMLEPHLDAQGMENHYEGHHELYRRGMNAVIKEWRDEQPENDFARESILKILQHIAIVPDKYRNRVNHLGGGYVNHCFYFGVMSPNLESETREPAGYLAEELDATFGGFKEFQSRLEATAEQLYGSGYVWLVRNANGNLNIQTTANENSPISTGVYPILVVDLWEHAYQSKHLFHRQNYIRDWWNVVDWGKVEKLDQWWKDLIQKEKEEYEMDEKDEL